MAKAAARNCWCFTLNNYTDREYDDLKRNISEAKPIFSIIGRERGQNGTPHLQGFIHLSKRLRFPQVKFIIGSRAHIEPSRGTDEQNEQYCSKEDTNAWRFGEPNIHSPGVRRPVQQHSTVIALVHKIASGQEILPLLTESADSTMAYLRYGKIINDLAATQRRNECLDKLRIKFRDAKLRRYQKRIADMVSAPADPRKIHWFYDEIGNTGKSWMTQWLCLFKGAIRLCNGRTTDICYAYSGEPIVVFDLTRSVQDILNYQVMEEIKNGMVFSGKYQSCSKMYEIPHVIVFANWRPDESKMSQDRWDIQRIRNIHQDMDFEEPETFIVSLGCSSPPPNTEPEVTTDTENFYDSLFD